MTVGITYDLRSEWLALGYSELETAELDREETVEAVDSALRAEGYATERIGSFRGLSAALAAGKTWDLVFNFCEGMHGLGRESLVPALLDAYRIPYTFSDPAVLAVALHKGLAKRVVRDAGVRTPDFAVIEGVTGRTAVRELLPMQPGDVIGTEYDGPSIETAGDRDDNFIGTGVQWQLEGTIGARTATIGILPSGWREKQIPVVVNELAVDENPDFADPADGSTDGLGFIGTDGSPNPGQVAARVWQGESVLATYVDQTSPFRSDWPPGSGRRRHVVECRVFVRSQLRGWRKLPVPNQVQILAGGIGLWISCEALGCVRFDREIREVSGPL